MKLKEVIIIFIYLSSLLLSVGLTAATRFTMERANESEITYYLKASNLKSDRKALLVLIQGSDCNSVYHNKLINETFSAVIPGADVLTVEKYGIDLNLKWVDNPDREDCPHEYIANDSPKQRVSDYKQVLEQLMRDRTYNRVVLLGGSEGAVVANILASDINYVDQTVSLNGGGRWFVDDVLHSIKAESSSEESYKESANEFMGFTNYFLASEPFEMDVSSHGYKWWRSTLEIDQTLILEKINIPVLIIQAGRDQNVSVQYADIQAAELMKSKSNVTYKTYSELDHSFRLPSGVSSYDKVVDDIKLWLAQLQ